MSQRGSGEAWDERARPDRDRDMPRDKDSACHYSAVMQEHRGFTRRPVARVRYTHLTHCAILYM